MLECKFLSLYLNRFKALLACSLNKSDSERLSLNQVQEAH